MHEPVLKEEVLRYLDPKPGYVVLDATVGGGGHSEAILEKILPGGKLFGFDQDSAALERTRERLSRFGDSVHLIETNFRNLDQALSKYPALKFDSILLDLGFSSDQIDDPLRGFSFRIDAPLDMRMSLKSEVTAADLINSLPEREIADIFYKFGEEHRSRYFARAVVEARRKSPIHTTLELANLIEKTAGGRHGKTHPATKVFQALRIAVNDELGAVEETVPKALQALKAEGRLAVITFHSLEDRIVKNVFKAKEKEGIINILTRKVVAPTREEYLKNPRSRSAKLRVAERRTIEL